VRRAGEFDAPLFGQIISSGLIDRVCAFYHRGSAAGAPGLNVTETPKKQNPELMPIISMSLN